MCFDATLESRTALADSPTGIGAQCSVISRGLGFSIFPFPISALTHAAGATKRCECETNHGDGVNNGEAQEPRGGAGVPLAPDGDAAIQSEEGEDCAGGFVKELADGAPHYAQSDFGGAPESGVEARGHRTILVQNARRRGGDWLRCRTSASSRLENGVRGNID
jgi:hypothetical protein